MFFKGCLNEVFLEIYSILNPLDKMARLRRNIILLVPLNNFGCERFKEHFHEMLLFFSNQIFWIVCPEEKN